MDEVDKAALCYYLSSISVSLAKLTGEEDYSKETHKTASSILDTMLKKYEEEME